MSVRIDSPETFLEVWDALGELVALSEARQLPPEMERHWESLIVSVKSYEAETMRPPAKGESSFENDGWFAVMRQAMAFRDAMKG